MEDLAMQTTSKKNQKSETWLCSIFLFLISIIFIFTGIDKSISTILPLTAVFSVFYLINNKISFFSINKSTLILFLLLVTYLFIRPERLFENYKLAQAIFMATITGFTAYHAIPRYIPITFCILPALFAMQTILFFIQGMPLKYYFLEDNGNTNRLMLFFDNPNILGLFLMFSISTSVLVFNNLPKAVKYLLIPIDLLCFYSLIATSGRTAILGTAVAIIYRILTLKNKKAILLCIGICLLACSSILYFNQELNNRLKNAINTPRVALENRILIWEVVANKLSNDKPLWGFSKNSFTSTCYDYISNNEAELRKNYSQYHINQTKNAIHAHNLLLSITYKFGFIGFFLFLALLINTIVNIKGKEFVLIKGIIIMLIAYSLFEDLSHFSELFAIFLFYPFGIYCATSRQSIKNANTPNTE